MYVEFVAEVSSVANGSSNVHEAVEIEIEFVCDALCCALIGMNAALMSQYIKFVTDHLLVVCVPFYPQH